MEHNLQGELPSIRPTPLIAAQFRKPLVLQRGSDSPVLGGVDLTRVSGVCRPEPGLRAVGSKRRHVKLGGKVVYVYELVGATAAREGRNGEPAVKKRFWISAGVSFLGNLRGLGILRYIGPCRSWLLRGAIEYAFKSRFYIINR